MTAAMLTCSVMATAELLEKRNKSLNRVGSLLMKARKNVNDHIQVITTTQKKADAEKIAERLIEKKLVGCVQIIGPISSKCRWEEKIEKRALRTPTATSMWSNTCRGHAGERAFEDGGSDGSAE